MRFSSPRDLLCAIIWRFQMHLAWWDQRYKLLKHTWCCGSKCYSSKMSERQVRPPSALWNSEMSTGTTSPANCLKWGSRSPASVDEISSVSPTHRVLAAPATETWNDLKCWAVIFCSSSNIACASSLSSTASVLGAMHVNADLRWRPLATLIGWTPISGNAFVSARIPSSFVLLHEIATHHEFHSYFFRQLMAFVFFWNADPSVL